MKRILHLQASKFCVEHYPRVIGGGTSLPGRPKTLACIVKIMDPSLFVSMLNLSRTFLLTSPVAFSLLDIVVISFLVIPVAPAFHFVTRGASMVSTSLRVVLVLGLVGCANRP